MTLIGYELNIMTSFMLSSCTQQRTNYDAWLNQLVSSYQTILENKADGKPDSKDKAFAKFLLDLPSVPTDVLDLLRDLSVDPEKYVACQAPHHLINVLIGCTLGLRVFENSY
jgi:hypothetical protein